MLAPINVTSFYALVHEHDGYVRLLRTETPYGSAAEVAEDVNELTAAVMDLPAERLLLDLRGGPAPRNDAEFEVAQRAFRAALHKRFTRIAVLVRSSVGRLQIQRLCRSEGLFAKVYLEESEAIAHLVEGLPAPAPASDGPGALGLRKSMITGFAGGKGR